MGGIWVEVAEGFEHGPEDKAEEEGIAVCGERK